MKKVSVAIICYNQENFIRETLDSVIIQDYPNIEICIADDYSTDSTPRIIEEYAKKLENHPQISFKYFLSEPNVGIVANYNNVVELCTGDYIAWLDGDDLFLPGKLTAQVAFMESHPNCVISHTNADIFDNATNQTIKDHGYLKNPCNGKVQVLLRNGADFVNCTSMVVAKWQKQVKFNTKYRVLGDWLNKVDILFASGGEINYLNHIFSRHRKHGANASSVKTNCVGQNVLDFINQHIDLIHSYPKYSNDILFGLSRAYRVLGKYNNVMFYKTAFYICPYYWRNILMYIAVILRIKRNNN